MKEHRTIVVGLATDDLHSGLLGVAGSQAEPCDTIRLVHVYLPPVVTELDWAVPERSGDAAYAAAAELVARAKAALARGRSDAVIEVQVAGGTPAAVLEHVAAEADLVVVGASRQHALRPVGLTLARTSSCPVLVVDSAPRADAPVTVLLPGATVDGVVLDAAFAWAARRATPLVVLRPWRPGPDVDVVVAETVEQKSLDEYLSGWLERYPHVGVSVELRLGDAADVTVEHAARAQVLVVGHALGQRDSLADTAVRQRRPLTLVVPVAGRRPRTAVGRPAHRIRSMGHHPRDRHVSESFCGPGG